MDLQSIAMVEVFVRRPFFLLMSVDAPLYHRFQRCQQCVYLVDKHGEKHKLKMLRCSELYLRCHWSSLYTKTIK